MQSINCVSPTSLWIGSTPCLQSSPIELKFHEEQDKSARIVTGSSGSVKHAMYDEYINASKGKAPVKGKGKQGDGKGGNSNLALSM